MSLNGDWTYGTKSGGARKPRRRCTRSICPKCRRSIALTPQSRILRWHKCIPTVDVAALDEGDDEGSIGADPVTPSTSRRRRPH